MNTLALVALIGMLSGGKAEATKAPSIPDENYEFLSVPDSRCIPKIGVGIEPEHCAECQRMTEPKHYRGTWYVAFETSIFTPAGKPSCVEGVTLDYCPDLLLEGKALPWPGRWSCARKIEIDFVGRRTVWPGLYGNALNYRLVVDRLISAKRLPDPPHDAGECDEAAQ